MTFSFQSFALVDSDTLSKFIWGVDDAAADATVGLTTQQKTSVELLVNAISKQITRHVSSNIKSAQYVEVWDGAASDELVPTERPIVSVDKFIISASNDWAGGTDLVAQGGQNVIVFTDGTSIKLRSVKTPMGRGLIQVTYTAGYATVPEDIQLALLMQFQWAYKQIGKGDTMVGLQSIAKMHESQTKDKDLNTFGLRAEVVGLLNPYKRFEAPLSVMFTRVS